MPAPSSKSRAALLMILALLVVATASEPAASQPPRPEPAVSEVDDREEIVPTQREFTINWFARTQSDAGNWPCEFEYDFIIDGDPSLRRGEQGYDVGVTAEVLRHWPSERIAAGESDPYAKSFERALDWLLAQQNPDGIFGDKKKPAWILQHAIATRFLTRAIGSYPDPQKILQPTIRALKVLADEQRKDGCWRLDGKDDARLTVHCEQAFTGFPAELAKDDETFAEIKGAEAKTHEWFQKELGSRGWSKSTGEKKTNAKLPKKRAEALASLEVLRLQTFGGPFAVDDKDYRKSCEKILDDALPAIEARDIDALCAVVEILTPHGPDASPKPPAETVTPELAKELLAALTDVSEKQIKEGTFRGSWATGHKNGLPSSIHYHTARVLEIATLDGWRREGLLKLLNERAAAAESND